MEEFPFVGIEFSDVGGVDRSGGSVRQCVLADDPCLFQHARPFRQNDRQDVIAQFSGPGILRTVIGQCIDGVPFDRTVCPSVSVLISALETDDDRLVRVGVIEIQRETIDEQVGIFFVDPRIEDVISCQRSKGRFCQNDRFWLGVWLRLRFWFRFRFRFRLRFRLRFRDRIRDRLRIRDRIRDRLRIRDRSRVRNRSRYDDRVWFRLRFGFRFGFRDRSRLIRLLRHDDDFLRRFRFFRRDDVRCFPGQEKRRQQEKSGYSQQKSRRHPQPLVMSASLYRFIRSGKLRISVINFPYAHSLLSLLLYNTVPPEEKTICIPSDCFC